MKGLVYIHDARECYTWLEIGPSLYHGGATRELRAELIAVLGSQTLKLNLGAFSGTASGTFNPRRAVTH